MKKINLLIVLILSVFLVTGCKEQKVEHVEGTLPELMDKLYDAVPEENMIMGLTNFELNNDNIDKYIGTKDIDYKAALAKESLAGSFAHSVILIRAENVNDVEDIKKTIKENVDPKKWVCVWVEEEDVVIKSKGDLILVNIVEDEVARDAITKAFDEL